MEDTLKAGTTRGSCRRKESFQIRRPWLDGSSIESGSMIVARHRKATADMIVKLIVLLASILGVSLRASFCSVAVLSRQTDYGSPGRPSCGIGGLEDAGGNFAAAQTHSRRPKHHRAIYGGGRRTPGRQPCLSNRAARWAHDRQHGSRPGGQRDPG